MHTNNRLLLALVICATILLATMACSPAAPATPTPTKVPASTPAASAKAETTVAPPTVAKPAATPVPPTPTPKPVTLKWASVSSLSDSALLLAEDKGYFKEQGIILEHMNITSLSDQIPVLAKGDLDFAKGGFADTIPNAVLRGLPVKIIADGGSNYPGYSYQAITVRKDLYDDGKIRAPSDLKGKRAGVSTVQSMARYYAPVLAQAGLTTKDLEYVPMSQPDMLTAFANKSIDIAWQMEPTLSQAVSAGLIFRWKDVGDYKPGMVSGVILGSPKLLEDKDLAGRWMIAYIKGIRDYMEALRTGQGIDRIIDLAIKNTPVKDRELYQTMLKNKAFPGYHLDGYVNKDSLVKDHLEFAFKEGYLSSLPDVNTILDNSPIESALQKLGKKG